MLAKVEDAGKFGVVKDLSKANLPLGAWSDARNVRFLDGYAQQFLGHGAAYGAPQVTPYHVLPVNVAGQRFWLYAGAEKIFATTIQNGTVRHINLTRTSSVAGLKYAAVPKFGVLGISSGMGGTSAGLLPGVLNNAKSTHIAAPSFSLSALQFALQPANVPAGVNGSLVAGVITNDANYNMVPNQITSTLLGGIPIINPGNLIDPPQRWNLDINMRCQTLDNWPAGWFCKSLRTYKQFLVALGNVDDRGALPLMVKWSTAAEPGTVPSTWDGGDPTALAGEVDLAEGGDPILDGLQLRDSFMIYKEQSVWRMDFVGGQDVMRFQKVFGVSGAMNRNCIVEIDGVHVVLTGSDVVAHDGQTVTQVLDKQARRTLFQDMDVDATDRAFVVKNPFLNEVFICYASIGFSVPNRALVWNYKDKTVSYRDIPALHHANYGTVDNVRGGTWESDPDPWDSDLTAWDGPDFTPSTTRVLMASDVGKLYLLDSSASYDGVKPDAVLERVGLSFGEAESIKLIKGIRARITGNLGETVMIDVGASPDPYTLPTYSATMTHTIGQTVACDCFVSGRYIALRLRSGSAYFWRLDAYDIDVGGAGKW